MEHFHDPMLYCQNASIVCKKGMDYVCLRDNNFARLLLFFDIFSCISRGIRARHLCYSSTKRRLERLFRGYGPSVKIASRYGIIDIYEDVP